MGSQLDELVEHNLSEDCPVCHAQQLVDFVLLPAAAAWEKAGELPRFSVALHGAAQLLGVMIEQGIARTEIESALGRLLDDIERQIAEDTVMGGPTQGTA